MSLLEVRDLAVRFDGGIGRVPARAVDGVSLDVARGEVVGLVGESGCGKTVTALAVMGLLNSAEVGGRSSIRFQGEELVGAPPATLRALRGEGMAMIFQDPMTALNPVLRVGPQVVETLRHRRGLDRTAARERGIALLAQVGLSDPDRCFDLYPHELSGGMSQRAMIAMALSCEPALLIADEPTTALDVTVQAQVLDLLAGLRDEMGLLLVTHDLGVVARVCDRVIVMYAGQVVEEAPVSALFTRPRHPYTRGLLGSLPRIDDRRGRLRPIRGSVPPATAWPTGCRFRERCDYAWERCAGEQPDLFRTVDGDGDGDGGPRASRCWLVREPERDRPPGSR
jgi:peptide/nickel transport system ATP-binding protein